MPPNTLNFIKMQPRHAKLSQNAPQSRQNVSKNPSNTPNSLKGPLKHTKLSKNGAETCHSMSKCPSTTRNCLKIPLNHTRLPQNCVWTMIWYVWFNIIFMNKGCYNETVMSVCLCILSQIHAPCAPFNKLLSPCPSNGLCTALEWWCTQVDRPSLCISHIIFLHFKLLQII